MFMITKEYLADLSSAEKDAIILHQAKQIEELKEQIHELRAVISQLQAQNKPKKNSRNSSIPPSQDQKPNHPIKEKKAQA